MVLGLETSCDETSAAIVHADGGQLRVLSNVVSSQIALHERYGGVVPEIASRAHLEAVLPVIELALTRASLTLADLGAIAVTHGPGLVGALMVGVQTAKALATALDLPLVPVNHIEAHIAAVHLSDGELPEQPVPAPPFVALAVSGGHTALYRVDTEDRFTMLGQTLDDAAGEAYDKTAMLLGLGYPGGALIDRLARTGDPATLTFPRAFLSKRPFDFSFSGLKTSVRTHVARSGVPTGQALSDLCASFQAAVVEVLVTKSRKAAESVGTSELVVAGGVAANAGLRAGLDALAHRKGRPIRALLPPLRYCSDNAAMVAGLGARRLERGLALRGAARFALDANPGLRCGA